MMRPCDVCGRVDDQPRHIHADTDGDHIRHLGCCASAGCPTNTCTTTAPTL